ncbi:MAG: protoporphyrinogen oxidase HemJ [Rhizobiales bacterium TMED83]|nr:TIGR00701 family protein [Rhodobiaceae bacterium]RPF94128.1 MAG: protoporphyrinogen oxidase HemJ [Rhizobiales bacterium TMED83]
MDFVWQISDWVEAFHVISVMFWMAGMYYLPRLFVYHAEAMETEQPFQVFEKMEANLLRIIMNPAMIAAWIFGLLLITRPGFALGAGIWLWTKLALVILLSGYHGFLAVERKKFLMGAPPHSSRFYRMINEVPPVLTIIIVVLVVVQPF